MTKNVKTLFLGRKRKRRGSMRFYKNVRTRCLGFHIKWLYPPKVTYPPFFDPFSHFDQFLLISIFTLLSFSHFLHFCILLIFVILVKFVFLLKVPLFVIRPYYGVKILKIRVGEITQGSSRIVCGGSPLFWFFGLLLFIYDFMSGRLHRVDFY